jgi:hypothetical protein
MTQRGAWTPEKVRNRIRTGVLVKRLEKHALGKLDMTEGQRAATLALLRKTLPDLQAVDITHKGDPAHPIMVSQTDSNL